VRSLITVRAAVLSAVAAIDADLKRLAKASDACRRLMTIPGVGHLTALAFIAAIDDPQRFRRSRDIGAYLGLVPRRYQSGEIDRQHLQVRRSTRADAALRGGKCHADALQATAKAEGLGLGHRHAIDYAKGAHRPRPPSRHHHARHAPAGH
jgi:transposase